MSNVGKSLPPVSLLKNIFMCISIQHNVPSSQGPLCANSAVFLDIVQREGQQVKTRVHELCCRFRKLKRTFNEQKSQGMVDKMLVLLTMSTGPGPTNRGNCGLVTRDTLGGPKKRLQRSKFMWFLLCLLSAVGAGGAKIVF